MTHNNAAKIVWVADNLALHSWCQHFSKLSAIAVDTEFVRKTTYYPIVGLIQISDGETALLIDPLSVTDWQPLVELMLLSSVTKVFHACSEDLEVFDRLLGILPKPLYDTQIGEAYASANWSLSYVKLVQAYKNITLVKDETTSD